MTALWGAGLLALATLPLPISGWAYCYHPGVMAAVARARGIPLDWAADGFASTPDCALIGGYLTARVAGRPVTLQVLDCSAPADLPHQRRPRSEGGLGLVLEVDWQLAHTLGWAVYGGDHGLGRAPATIERWSPGPTHVLTAFGLAPVPRQTRARALAAAHARRDGAR